MEDFLLFRCPNLFKLLTTEILQLVIALNICKQVGRIYDLEDQSLLT